MAKHIKITGKRTYMVFPSINEKRAAEDFLLKRDVPFQGIVRKPVLSVAPSNYVKHDLDLYLNDHIAATCFNFKTK